jgi:hypothetical protein
MRKIIVPGIVMAIAALVLGCGRSQVVQSTPNGKVTVTKSATGKVEGMKVETKEGSATYTANSGKTLTEAELGAPVYPGAKEMMAGNFESNKATSQPGFKQHILTTTDSFDKVAAFYKSNLKNVKNQSEFGTGPSKMAMFVVGEGELTVQVTADAKQNQTMIHVIKKQ